MRANGVAERYCTGDASDWETFEAWARTVPFTLRNPLYHWTHLELAFPFGVNDRLLNESTARGIFDATNERLKQPGFSTLGLLEQYDVKVVCTTDDPVDSLEHHIAHREAPKAYPALKLLPTWRPDKAMAVGDLGAYNAWLAELEAAANRGVASYDDLLAALDQRHAFFHQVGCRLSDRGLDIVPDTACTGERARALFDKARRQQELSLEEQGALRWPPAPRLGRARPRSGLDDAAAYWGAAQREQPYAGQARPQHGF
jgi:glucuronate isomerase